MNPFVELNLAFLLFLPWYLVLAALFWMFPRGKRPMRVRVFELASLLVAIGAAVVGGVWGFQHADLAAGAIWKQVLASLVCYGLFLAVLTIAALVRRVWWKR
jgi:hypothetical protein